MSIEEVLTAINEAKQKLMQFEPKGRITALVFTKLDEAYLWARELREHIPSPPADS